MTHSYSKYNSGRKDQPHPNARWTVGGTTCGMFQAFPSHCFPLAGHQDSEGELPLTQPLLRTDLDSLLASTVSKHDSKCGGVVFGCSWSGLSGKYIRGLSIFRVLNILNSSDCWVSISETGTEHCAGLQGSCSLCDSSAWHNYIASPKTDQEPS